MTDTLNLLLEAKARIEAAQMHPVKKGRKLARINRNIEAAKRLDRIAACLEVSDLDIMEANGAGMDAYSDGKSVHDNPYQQQDLRNAWHEGWRSAERHRGD